MGSQSHLPVPASLAEKKTWHEVEATIEHATDGTCFYFAGNSSNSGNHGFCVDDILVTRLPPTMEIYIYGCVPGLTFKLRDKY